jgi:hypothetical protein
VGQTLAALAAVKKELCVDVNRVYGTGCSNGTTRRRGEKNLPCEVCAVCLRSAQGYAVLRCAV